MNTLDNAKINEYAEALFNTMIYAHVSSLVNRALATAQDNLGDEWLRSGYDYENIIHAYDEENECYYEIAQWFMIDSFLFRMMREMGEYTLLETDDGHFWGRHGCGYSVVEDLKEVARYILSKR